jgi:DNA-directed RNA polymerase subunit RPC12/RpoP
MKRTVSECHSAGVKYRSDKIDEKEVFAEYICLECHKPCSTKTIEVEENLSDWCGGACKTCSSEVCPAKPIIEAEIGLDKGVETGDISVRQSIPQPFDYEKWKIEKMKEYKIKYPLGLFDIEGYNIDWTVEQFLSSALDELNLKRAK